MQSLKLPDGNIKVLVEGVERAKVVSVADEEGFFRATVRTASYKVEPGPQLDALVSRVTGLFEQYVKLSQNLNAAGFHFDAHLPASRLGDGEIDEFEISTGFADLNGFHRRHGLSPRWMTGNFVR